DCSRGSRREHLNEKKCSICSRGSRREHLNEKRCSICSRGSRREYLNSKTRSDCSRPLKKSKKTRFQNYVGILSFFSYNESNKKADGYNATKTTNNDFKSIYRNL